MLARPFQTPHFLRSPSQVFTNISLLELYLITLSGKKEEEGLRGGPKNAGETLN